MAAKTKVKRIPKFIPEHQGLPAEVVEFYPYPNVPGYTHRVCFSGTWTRKFLAAGFGAGAKAAVFFVNELRGQEV